MSSSHPLILVANPGSASRKYGLYRGNTVAGELHFEWEDHKIVCTVQTPSERFSEPVGLHDLEEVLGQVETMLLRAGALQDGDTLDGIGLRVVAPSSFFLANHHLTPSVRERLAALHRVAPLHIGIVLRELELLEQHFPGVPVYGISDSGFHATKPAYAWNYGISLEDADRYEIKRFGYHGLSVQSSLHHLHRHEKMANKIIVAHLGSGGSITALHGGKSLDNTMGYSPLEGIIMATRSGTIDYSAVRALQTQKELSNDDMELYLNTNAGLLGLGDSPDIRELLGREEAGDSRAKLALDTYAYAVQKSIGQMSAALGGVDALVFTGTVGERSATMRRRIVERLHYLDLILDIRANTACQDPLGLEVVSKSAVSKPIYVVHADEALEIARQTGAMLPR